MCHNPNATDVPYRKASQGPETPLDFKVLVHSIHAGARRETPFVVIGRGGTAHDFSGTEFPGTLSNCLTCHRSGTYAAVTRSGALGTTVNSRSTLTEGAPLVNNDPDDDDKVTPITAACSSCHDDTAAKAHMVANGGSFMTTQRMISTRQVRERCTTCHGPGRSRDVGRVHGVVDRQEGDDDRD
jgi:OmcA/MtrC family decaheme c-type cytochrome